MIFMSYTQQDVIKAFMASLDTTTLSGTAALNEAVNAASKGKFKTIQAAINQMKSDITTANDAAKFQQDFCGIDLTNDDTGAITGSDVGGSTTKNAKSVVPESTAFQAYNYNSVYLSDYGLSIYLSEIDDYGYVTKNYVSGYEVPSRDVSTLSDKEKYVWSAYCDWWAKEGIKLVQESYGTNFNFTASTLLTPRILYFGFYYSDNGSTADSGPLSFYNNSTKEKTAELEMRVNMTTFSTIDTSDPNGSNSNGDHLDMSIAHEFTHCLMAANINYYMNLPQFIREGMAELTVGADVGSLNQYYLNALASPSALTTSGSNKSLLDQALDLSNTSTGDAKAYAGGYMFLRYLAKQSADSGGLNISNSNKNTVINGGSENDSIINNSGASNTKIYGGDGDDSIINFASTVTIMGGDGKDNTSNSGSNVTISGGNGDDSLSASGNNVSISGDAGNDYIYIYNYNTEKITVNGGTGNDTINSTNTNGILYQYKIGDGFDSIVGAKASDTIKIIGGTYKPSTVGSNLVLSAGSGAVTLVGAANIALTIDGTLEHDESDGVISLTSGNDTYANSLSGATIYALSGNDNITNNASSAVIFGGDGADSVYNSAASVTIDGGAGNDSINNWGERALLIAGLGNDIILSERTAPNTTIDASAGGSNSIRSVGNSSKIITGSGNDSVAHGGGVNGTWYGNKATIDTGAGNDTVQIYAGGDSVYADVGSGADTVLIYGSRSTIDAGEGDDSVYSYGNSQVSIYGGAGNDKITVAGDSSTVRGGAGNDFITDTNGGTVGNVYIYDGSDGNDTISGANSYDTLKIEGGTYSLSGSTVSVYSGDNLAGTIRLVDSANVKIDGTIKPVTDSLPSGWKYGNTAKTNLTASIASAASLDASQTYGNGVTTINASKITGGANIVGNSLNNSIKGGSGADSITGGGGVLIQDYVAGTDKIKLASGAITGASLSGSNVILQTSDGSITVKNGKNKKITVIDGSDHETTNVYPLSTLPAGISVSGAILTASTVFTGSEINLADYATNVTKVNASALSRGVSIVGSAAANSLKGSKGADHISGNDGNDTIYGGAGNDTIWGNSGTNKLYGDAGDDYLVGGWGVDTVSGGAGNDTLYGQTGNDSLSGGAGNDVLIGGSGNDTLTGGAGNDIFWHYDNSGENDLITDYAAGQDKIRLSGATIKSANVSGTSVVFTFDNSTLTVKNGKGKKITVIDSAGRETTQIYSSNGNAAVPWFAEDDTNFISSGARLDDISAENYSVTNIETDSDFETLAQISIAAYSSEK